MKRTPHYDKDFTHGFDTQNYPKLQASLGTQPENTRGIQTKTQPIPEIWFGSGYYPWVPEFWVPNPHHTPHYVKVEKYQKVCSMYFKWPSHMQTTNEKNKKCGSLSILCFDK